MKDFSEVIFYQIEKAIKTYRQLAQRRLKAAGLRITVDQWLILSALEKDPSLTQKQLAANIFKDEASVTRIIVLLEKGGYLNRKTFSADQRRSYFRVTPDGKQVLKAARRVVTKYRADALEDISGRELVFAKKILEKIIANCYGSD